MPTVDIPDKICPHCGGTKWKIEYEKRPYWIRTRYRCAKKSQERLDKWQLKNPEKLLEYSRRGSKVKTLKSYWKSEAYRGKQNKRYYINKENLTDRHIKHLLAHESELSQSDIPQELIEIKRKQLILKRKLKNNAKS
jgi:hypothetical protein